jgi:hypothetical protein
MSDYLASSSRRRSLFLVLLCLFLFALVLRVALTLNREVDIDEFQHLHSAWLLSQHYVLYRDVWENHPPLFYYLLLPLFRFCREGPGLVLLARVIMSFAGLGILLLTYVLARIDHDKLPSFLAVLILSYMVIFAQKSIEVRPDQFLIILWLASLWISIRAFSNRQRLGFFVAGLLLGIGFLFSQKALLPFAAMSFTFLVCSYIRGSQKAFVRFLRIQSGYTLGFMIPVAACLVFFYHSGTLKEMITSTVLESFTYPNNYRPFYLLQLRNICFFLLASAGVIIHLWRLRKNSASVRADQLLLLLPGLFLLLVFLFLQTAPYPQSALLFAPVLAIYGAEAFRRSMDGILISRKSVAETNERKFRLHAKALLPFTAALATGLIIPGTILLVRGHPFSRTNAEQFRRMEYVLDHTQSTDAVFDGESAYVFRPQAYFYGSLFHAIVWRIEHGEIKQDIPESLTRTHCRVVIYDERVSTLPPAVQLFLKANYAPSEFPGVYLARKR